MAVTSHLEGLNCGLYSSFEKGCIVATNEKFELFHKIKGSTPEDEKFVRLSFSKWNGLLLFIVFIF